MRLIRLCFQMPIRTIWRECGREGGFVWRWTPNLRKKVYKEQRGFEKLFTTSFFGNH